MEWLLPILQDILSWAVIAALGWMCVQLKLIVKHTKLMEQSNKSLMRADLIERYKKYRDNGHWISDDHRDEWLSDWETYSALHGKNGYLEAAKEDIINMPAHRPPESEPDTLF